MQLPHNFWGSENDELELSTEKRNTLGLPAGQLEAYATEDTAA